MRWPWGASRTIGRVVLSWEAAYGHHYKLQVSGDTTNWTDVYSTLDGHGGVEDIVLETPATGRYVRMLGLRRATQYGYSLYELQVYGPSSPNQAPTVSNINRSTATNTLSALAATELRGAFTDPDAGDYLQTIKITSLPTHGVLTAAGVCDYTSNALNQYAAAGGVNYTYDPNGNLTSDGTNLYRYDLENRLIRVRRADTQQELSSYVYDAAGRRVEKWFNGVTPVKYVYDGARCIAEYNGSDQLLRKYIYGPGVDEPICMIEASGSYAGTYYYHFDALSSVVALTDDEGDTVQAYEYDVYGRVGATDASHPNRMMFTGREYDKETGLYYYRARYYNPQIGRFLQTDPIGYGDGMNLYRYCSNNPLGMVDPSGRDSEVSLIEDPCDVEYVEWTGSWEIRKDDLQPGGRKFTESVKKGAAEMKWVVRIATLGTFILGVGSPGGSVELGAGQGDLTVLGAAAQKILEIIDSCDIPGYYRAYIQLKGYNKNGKGFFTGKTKYKCVWTKWVEVSGGGGHSGIAYETWEDAYKAIHDAAAAYSKPRPGVEIDVMTDEGLQEIVGEENNDG